MPVFDFSNTTTEKKDPECTYTVFRSNETNPSPQKPILVLDNTSRRWKHHSCGEMCIRDSPAAAQETETV